MPQEIQVVRPDRVSNRVYHLMGLAILSANNVRHRVLGERTPRPQDTRTAAVALRYDQAVVDNWFEHLRRHLRGELSLAGRHVLEIGPGPDLGTGLLLLAHGAASYSAIDVNPLVRRAPRDLHAQLCERIAQQTGADGRELRQQWDALLAGQPERLRYDAQRGLDLSQYGAASFDLVVSHAVFEHVERVERYCAELARICRPGALFAAEIDLQTHSRWIRDADPLNIYRYPDAVYAATRFPGAPNRLRPDDYLTLLERQGWVAAHVYPRRVLDPSYVARVEPSLAARFRGDPERLGWLSMMLCATFGSPA